jgi:hypothetical protein
MLHGKGNQAFLTESFEEERQKGLKEKTNLTEEEQDYYEISGSQGGGSTLSDTFLIKQYPFPEDTTIRRRIKIDIRTYPEVGDKE